MSPHLYFIGALEAERAVTGAVRGTGTEPVATQSEQHPLGRPLVARLRAVLGAGLIRVGETVRGAECASPLADCVGVHP